MCRVHGPLAQCRCDYARKKAWFSLGPVLAAFLLAGCAALSSVTPADRAKAYDKAAATAALECKAYRFDRATGLTPDVPAMSKLCGLP